MLSPRWLLLSVETTPAVLVNKDESPGKISYKQIGIGKQRSLQHPSGKCMHLQTFGFTACKALHTVSWARTLLGGCVTMQAILVCISPKPTPTKASASISFPLSVALYVSGWGWGTATWTSPEQRQGYIMSLFNKALCLLLANSFRQDGNLKGKGMKGISLAFMMGANQANNWT